MHVANQQLVAAWKSTEVRLVTDLSDKLAMSILNYFRSVQTSKETGIGDCATKVANRAVKSVLSEVNKPQRNVKCTLLSVTNNELP